MRHEHRVRRGATSHNAATHERRDDIDHDRHHDDADQHDRRWSDDHHEPASDHDPCCFGVGRAAAGDWRPERHARRHGHGRRPPRWPLAAGAAVALGLTTYFWPLTTRIYPAAPSSASAFGAHPWWRTIDAGPRR
jgi:hypothetical protein